MNDTPHAEHLHTVGTPARDRLIGLDVTRGVALIGVCVMNYHGYLNSGAAQLDRSTLGKFFNPWTGPLSTRFAAVFVAVAGIGVVLLARRAIASGDPARVAAVRWRLARRGLMLLAAGYVLDWIWSGTILWYYGGLFLVGAAVVTLRDRWVLALGAASVLASAGIQWWSVQRTAGGHSTAWLLQGHSEATQSPRDLLFDLFVRGTHPLVPWLGFFCLGILLGRRLPWPVTTRVNLAFAGTLCLAAGYGLSAAVGWHPHLASTHPFDRGLFYVLSTVGSTLLAVTAISWLAERTRSNAVTEALAVAGRTTLTLYVLHVLVFRLVVDWLGWLDVNAGLGTALAFAVAYWAVAVLLANLWADRVGQGPLEWVYRTLSE
ncbi:MAG: DUF418 domain-containing protein [Acidimicrobiaceae bacterium]|nr:DUF418 domain-containing protein [Acidimicrobiaceae bacterium]